MNKQSLQNERSSPLLCRRAGRAGLFMVHIPMAPWVEKARSGEILPDPLPGRPLPFWGPLFRVTRLTIVGPINLFQVSPSTFSPSAQWGLQTRPLKFTLKMCVLGIRGD